MDDYFSGNRVLSKPEFYIAKRDDKLLQNYVNTHHPNLREILEKYALEFVRDKTKKIK